MSSRFEARIRVGFGVTVLARGMQSGGVDGIGSYTRELMKRVGSTPGVDLVPISYGFPMPPVEGHTGLTRQYSRYTGPAAMSAMTGLPFPGSRRLRGQIDLMHATDHLIPKLGGIPTVATLFDAIPLSHPEWVSIQHRVFKNALWRRAARWAAHIVTISEYSKREIEKHFGIPATRITAIPLGVDERWFRPIAPGKMAEVLGRHGIAAPFFLCVGTLQPRKNVGRVIEAYRSFPQSIRDAVPLVIVGRAGWRCEDIVDGLTAGAYGPSVRWLRHLPDDDLLAVMRAATVLVCPSLYEGFGLPVLEAFASGTPVVTSTASSLPEVAGDAALLVDPQDTGAIATAMLRLLEDTELADSLRQKGYARAREYSWDRTASRTLDVYRQVLGRA